MSFPPAFLDELRQRLTLSGLIARRVKLTRAGREFKGCCPFHSEKTPSFTVNDAKGFFHCFGCGAHGDAIGFTMRMDNLSFPDAVERLAGEAGMPVPQSSPQALERYKEEKNLATLLEDAARFFENQLRTPAGGTARDYLKSRGLTPETIANFRLGYAPDDASLIRHLTDKGYAEEQIITTGLARRAEGENRLYSFFRHRLMFPVGDRRGRVVAFGARLLAGDGPKYINSPEHPLFHKGETLYSYSRARSVAHQTPLIVVEGYMDVISLTQAGVEGAVAPLGTALTESQIQLLWKLLPPPGSQPPAHAPILCFDGDAAGQRAAARAMERLLPIIGPDRTVRIAFLPAGQDPDSLIRSEGVAAMRGVLAQSLPLVDALWNETLSARPLNSPEDRAGLKQALRLRLAQIADTDLRSLYRTALHEKLQTLLHPSPGENPRSITEGQPRPGLARRKPQSAEQLRDGLLLLLMINHPGLFAEHGDDLATLHFPHPRYESLRHDLVEFLAAQPEATPDDTQNAMTAAGHGAVIAGLRTDPHTRHFRNIGPESPTEEAQLVWNEQMQLRNRKQVLREIRRMPGEIAQDGTEQSYQRLLALREAAIAIDDPPDELVDPLPS